MHARSCSRAARHRPALALTVALGLLASSGGAAGAVPTVEGSGSTFAEVAINQWRSDVARSMGLSVNYSGTGSTAGRAQFAAGVRDFASSDVSYRFSDPGEPIPTFGFTYLPLVAGGTAIMYRLHDGAGRRITDLRLSPRTLGRVITWDIKHWDDPAVLAENPHLQGRIPHTEVRPVVRADGSGTTAVFTNYLVTVAPDSWNKLVAEARRVENDDRCQPSKPCDRWPRAGAAARAVQGSDQVAGAIASNVPSSEGTIGYAETAFALQRGLPIVRLQNAAGRFTLPTARAVAIALTQAGRNPDGTYNLSGVFGFGHPESYAISSYNYLVVPSTGSGFDPAKGDVLGRWMLYSITEGQRKADQLGYSPLPSNLIQQGFDVLRTVPGAPTPPDDPSPWGRFYESLNVDEAIQNPVAPPDTTASAPGSAASGGTASPSGATTATTGGQAAAAGGTAAGTGGRVGSGTPGERGATGQRARAGATAGDPSGASGPGAESASGPGATGSVAVVGGDGPREIALAPDPARMRRAAERLVAAEEQHQSGVPFVLLGLLLVVVVYVPPAVALRARRPAR